MINDDEALAEKYNAGLHLSSARLMSSSQRPPFEWVGASCHNREQLQQAQTLNLDYAVLSPIKNTLTHVDAEPLGWSVFSDLMPELPVYALGGMQYKDLAAAQAHGAHGIAMMRSPWQN